MQSRFNLSVHSLPLKLLVLVGMLASASAAVAMCSDRDAMESAEVDVLRLDRQGDLYRRSRVHKRHLSGVKEVAVFVKNRDGRYAAVYTKVYTDCRVSVRKRTYFLPENGR